MRSLWPQLWPNNEHWLLWVPDRARCARLSGTTWIDSIFKQPFRHGRASSRPSTSSFSGMPQDVDARVKPGQDESESAFPFSNSKFQIRPRILAARGARGFARTVRASENRGRRESRVANAPAASRAKLDKAHERSHHRFTGVDPAFPAQWFYGLLRALPGDQACLTPSPALLLADLTPASGRQNDTTWPYAS